MNNANDLFLDFHFKLKGCVDKHAPIKQLKPEEVELANKPWITPEICKMIKIRNKTFARKKRQPNNVNIKRIYNLFRNRVLRELKKVKKGITRIILKKINKIVNSVNQN